MELEFYGANKEVTGSCHCIHANHKRILIDCGLQQGQEEKENQQFPFKAEQIDAVLVTHAHIDHSGRLPLLLKNGFHGRIYATEKTCELLKIMLLDCAYIQESEIKWKNVKRKRAGLPPEEPLYTEQEAKAVIDYLVPCDYGQKIFLFDTFCFHFTDAGHLLGSASVTIDVKEGRFKRRLAFSGDIGNTDKPIIRDPQYLHDADYVCMESTYGNRIHNTAEDFTALLADVFENTFQKGGSVIIPAFAVGRTQELLYMIREMKERHLVSSIPDFPVYVDSPLAMEATQIYNGDLYGYADKETIEILQTGFSPLSFHNLALCHTVEESMALNEDLSPKVIISASGMCDAGRIRHHLRYHLWRANCSVVLVGFQAYGTLGRKLLEHPLSVRLFGEEVAVKAQIYNFHYLSGHADRDGLLKWIAAFTKKPRRIFVVHGEENAALSFAKELHLRGFLAEIPNYCARYDLLEEEFLEEGIDAARLRKKHLQNQSDAYHELLETGERIISAIHRSKGKPNKKLRAFSKQLQQMIEKWEK